MASPVRRCHGGESRHCLFCLPFQPWGFPSLLCCHGEQLGQKQLGEEKNHLAEGHHQSSREAGQEPETGTESEALEEHRLAKLLFYSAQFT